jgi:hypothetical protein
MAKNVIKETSKKDNYEVIIGCIAVQRSEDELLDLANKIAIKFGKTLVSSKIIRQATLEIEGVLKDDAVRMPIHFTSNNNDMGYTGSKLSTEQLLELNKKSKENS